VLGLAALMLAVGFTTLLIWRNVKEEPCAERAVSQSLSPDRRALAEVVEVNCASVVATHVSVRAAQGGAQSRRDVFVAAGVAPVTLVWEGTRELVVESPATHVVLQETSWHDVGVRVRLAR
jgi:hypothetical protein